jgi:hypothetical protein
MSHGSGNDRAVETNLSPSRAIGGNSANAASIPAVDTAADRRSDNVDDIANHSPIAPSVQTSRRGFLMNTMVSAASLATAAAVNVPTIANGDVASAMRATDSSPAASLARAEEVVSLLRTRYIRSGWKIDEAAAERALAYCRGYAADGSDPDDEQRAAIDFFHSHGQSVDWVFDAHHDALICGLAKHSKRASSIVDVELLALADQYAVAHKKWSGLSLAVDRMEDEFKYRRNPVPDTLRYRQSDADLGLPLPWPLPKDRPPIWERPVDVNNLREAKWIISSKCETEDETTVTLRKVTPSAAARARGDEIIAAYDEWHKEGKPPRGYKKALREARRADRDYRRLEKRVAETRATTFDGMLAKVRCAQVFAESNELNTIDGGGAAEVMALSIFEDLTRVGISSLVSIADASIAPDPIFAAIKRHKQTGAVWDAAVDVRSDFPDLDMTAEQREQRDELDEAVEEAWRPCEKAGIDMVTTAPTTPTGIVAAIAHVRAQMRDDGTYMPHRMKFEYSPGDAGDSKETMAWIDAFLDTIENAVVALAKGGGE